MLGHVQYPASNLAPGTVNYLKRWFMGSEDVSLEGMCSFEVMHALPMSSHKNSTKSHYSAHTNHFGPASRLVSPSSSNNFKLGHCLSVLGDLYNQQINI